MNLTMVDKIVNALLYEGYILYPYRASAVKNQLRFNFGVVYPRLYAEAQSGADAWTMQTQCLAVDAGSASLEICVRFLRIVDRVVGVRGETKGEPFRALPSLDVDGQVHECWKEAVESRFELPILRLQDLSPEPLRHEFFLPRECAEQTLRDSQDRVAGVIVRTSEPIHGVVEVSSEAVSTGAARVTVRIVNTGEVTPESDGRRERALGYSFISTHTLLGISGGEFVSLLEPSEELRDAAAGCRNEGTWPVLVGQAGQKDMILSSPIILYDYPAVAPESPGDLYDGAEIDEILTLRVLTLSDQEKVEARRLDERARRILDRAESLSQEQFAELHGTFRGAGEQS